MMTVFPDTKEKEETKNEVIKRKRPQEKDKSQLERT